MRPDQVHDDTVPQLDTPFLKVTLEDTERFGTTMEPLQTSSLPPMRMEPATAETIAATRIAAKRGGSVGAVQLFSSGCSLALVSN